TGVFVAGYATASLFVEMFREPDAHLGFLAGGITMGQVLSVPLLLFGIFMIGLAMRRAPTVPGLR
ncbi:MAG: prolipoprotein diacylglyceryl transferase, partial [Alphaproteobacteria bacterium]|nr:prolipoprotein diacylglyceryl transferase [Alphaproteobacteria bacterium]